MHEKEKKKTCGQWGAWAATRGQRWAKWLCPRPFNNSLFSIFFQGPYCLHPRCLSINSKDYESVKTWGVSDLAGIEKTESRSGSLGFQESPMAGDEYHIRFIRPELSYTVKWILQVISIVFFRRIDMIEQRLHAWRRRIPCFSYICVEVCFPRNV